MSIHFEPEEHVLSNGLPVIFQNHEGMVATTYWWNSVGSADELPKEAGFAHFLEHMLFKDAGAKETGKASTGEIAREIEALGGDINAYTSFDQTVYHFTCSEQHWERVLQAFGKMVRPQKFLKSDFDREREVILEELRRDQDSPGRQMFQELFSSTFARHPYGKPVIGYARTLKAARVGELEAFYRKHYVSGRMGLLMVGPFGDAKGARKKKLLALLEKYFGSRVFLKNTAPRAPRIIEPELRKKPELRVLPFDVKAPSLALGFRVPHLLHRDIPAIDVLGNVLGQGELSRLYQKLFYGRGIATEVSGGVYVPSDPGMLYFQGEAKDLDKISELGSGMLEELARIRQEGPTKEELERVIVASESEKMYATQTVDGVAGRLGFMRFVLGDLTFDRTYLDQLRGVGARDVQGMAEKYLLPERMSGVVMVPEKPGKFNWSALQKQAEQALKVENPAPVTVKPAGRTGLSPRIWEQPSGMKVIHLERPHSPLVSVHISALGGLRLERAAPLQNAENDWGVSGLLAHTWAKGTRSKNSREIATIIEGRAASLDGFAGRHSVGLDFTGLARDWPALSELLTEVLVEPSFAEDEIAHSKRVIEEMIRGVEDHSSQLASKLFLETLFEKHPYGRLTTGSLESLSTQGQRTLLEYHKAWIRPERLVVSISGNVSAENVKSWVEALESRLRSSGLGSPPRAFPRKLPDEPELSGPRWVERKLGREQVHILSGGLGITHRSEQRYALRLLQNILGGQSGRLFIELREKKSLAYTVAPMSFEGIERGYVGTYIGCSPSKRKEAIEGMAAVLEKLASQGPTVAEMKRAREFYLGRRSMDLQGDSSLASYFGLQILYDLDPAEEIEVRRSLEAVTAKEIKEVCQKYFVEPHKVTAVVG
jgi:zinc protease